MNSSNILLRQGHREKLMNEQKDWTTSTRTRSIAYWVTTVLIAAEFASGGVIDLLRVPIFGGQELGYPAYFDTIIGVWKILGACPAPKQNLSGAVGSRIAELQVFGAGVLRAK